tara:strand:+ start:420 stop:902 length:483 start_codon:yes stop_codon:yes gene_type:complete
MKNTRISKNPLTILSNLKEKGFTRAQIADSMGIKPRTLASYYDYFNNSRPNKNSRIPPPERVKALRKFAQSKKIRTTTTLVNEDTLVYAKVNYSVVLMDGEKTKRNVVLPVSLDVWRSMSKKKQKAFIRQQIKSAYGRSNTRPFKSLKIIRIVIVTKAEI